MKIKRQRDKVDPITAKRAKEEGVVQRKPNGKWGIISFKTNPPEWWNADYDSKESAENGLSGYHAQKNFTYLRRPNFKRELGKLNLGKFISDFSGWSGISSKADSIIKKVFKGYPELDKDFLEYMSFLYENYPENKIYRCRGLEVPGFWRIIDKCVFEDDFGYIELFRKDKGIVVYYRPYYSQGSESEFIEMGRGEVIKSLGPNYELKRNIINYLKRQL